MTGEKNFTKAPLPHELVSILAEHTDSSVDDICKMFSICTLCQQTARYPVVALDGGSWSGDSMPGNLRLALYGLCESCAALPDVTKIVNAMLFEGKNALN